MSRLGPIPSGDVSLPCSKVAQTPVLGLPFDKLRVVPRLTLGTVSESRTVSGVEPRLVRLKSSLFSLYPNRRVLTATPCPFGPLASRFKASRDSTQAWQLQSDLSGQPHFLHPARNSCDDESRRAKIVPELAVYFQQVNSHRFMARAVLKDKTGRARVPRRRSNRSVFWTEIGKRRRIYWGGKSKPEIQVKEETNGSSFAEV